MENCLTDKIFCKLQTKNIYAMRVNHPTKFFRSNHRLLNGIKGKPFWRRIWAERIEWLKTEVTRDGKSTNFQFFCAIFGYISGFLPPFICSERKRWQFSPTRTIEGAISFLIKSFYPWQHQLFFFTHWGLSITLFKFRH